MQKTALTLLHVAYDDMSKALVDMKSWARGKVVLKLVCDGLKRISQKLVNAVRKRVREAALDRLPSQKFDSKSEKHDRVDDALPAYFERVLLPVMSPLSHCRHEEIQRGRRCALSALFRAPCLPSHVYCRYLSVVFYCRYL